MPQGQPEFPGIWDVEVADVRALEAGGIAPGQIINAPNNFQLITSLRNDGVISAVLHGQPGTIRYRAERLEDNTVVTLADTPFVVPALVDFDVTSASFTSGPGANLDVGTYMVTAIVSMNNAPFSGIVAAFSQTLIRVI